MDHKVRVALLSLAHVHAAGYADQVSANPDAELVAIWDDDPARGQAGAAERNVRFFDDLDELLNRDDIDAVVVASPTALHAELLRAAANAGKHIFTEKALTITTADADQVVEAIRASGVKFMISLPSRADPQLLFAKKVVEDGLLGQITLMRARIAHSAALDSWFRGGDGHGGSLWFGDEKAAGGGAFFDLGCHRVDVMRWILGEPSNVVARMNNLSEAYPIDDNMVAVVEFRNKALGILDVSWVHRSGPNPLEIYGTQGFLTIGAGSGPAVQFQSTKVQPAGIKGVVSPTELPQAPPKPMNQWINAIKSDAPVTITLQDAWNLTQLMEGCYTAARTGLAIMF